MILISTPAGKSKFFNASTVLGVGGVIPKEFIPALIKGINDGLNTGVLAGYKLVDVKVLIVFGSYHDVDSSTWAFEICGSIALKEAARKCQPVLLEPIMKVDVVAPEAHVGDCIGDLNRRRGKIIGQESNRGIITVHSEVPLSEMSGYATSIRSLTSGRGSFTMEPLRFEPVPANIQKEIIQK